MNISRLLSFSFLWAAILSSHAFGQEADSAYAPRPEPKDPNLARIGMVRFWYVGEATSPSITLVKEYNQKQPEIIDTNLPPGTFSRYMPVKPGTLKLHVLDGKVTEPTNPEDKLPLEEKKLTEPVAAQIRGGTYSTIVLSSTNGKLVGHVQEDSKRSDSASPAVRIHNFTQSPAIELRLVKNALDQKADFLIWNSKSSSAEAEVELPNRNVYYIDAVENRDNGQKSIGFFEVQLARGLALSLVLVPGPDGTVFMRTAVDATPDHSYNAAYIKAVAERSE